MRHFAFFSDIIIRSFFIFLLVYLWVSFFVRGFVLTFLAAFLITALINAGIMFIQSKRKDRRTRTRAKLDHMERVLWQFKFMSPLDTAKLIHDALVKKQSNTENFSIFTSLHKQINEDEIIGALNQTEATKKTIIIAQSFPPELRSKFNVLKLDLHLVDFEALYDELLEPTNTFPTLTIEKNTNKKFNWKEFQNMFFTRKKAKSFVFVGVFILLSSFIVRPSIYYIIIATVVFGIAIVGFIRPNNQSSAIPF